MKKLCVSLFVLASLVLTTSCKKDDDGGNVGAIGNQIVATISGQPVIFDNVFVQPDTYTDFDGNTVTDLYVTALSSSDITKLIEIDVRLGALGPDAVDYFYYQVGEFEYEDYSFDSEFNSVVTVNDGSRLTMTFSGTLNSYDGEQSVIVENGVIDVIY